MGTPEGSTLASNIILPQLKLPVVVEPKLTVPRSLTLVSILLTYVDTPDTVTKTVDTLYLIQRLRK